MSVARLSTVALSSAMLSCRPTALKYAKSRAENADGAPHLDQRVEAEHAVDEGAGHRVDPAGVAVAVRLRARPTPPDRGPRQEGAADGREEGGHGEGEEHGGDEEDDAGDAREDGPPRRRGEGSHAALVIIAHVPPSGAVLRGAGPGGAGGTRPRSAGAGPTAREHRGRPLSASSLRRLPAAPSPATDAGSLAARAGAPTAGRRAPYRASRGRARDPSRTSRGSSAWTRPARRPGGPRSGSRASAPSRATPRRREASGAPSPGCAGPR